MSALSSPTSGTLLTLCPNCGNPKLRPYGMELALYAYYLFGTPILLRMRCSNCGHVAVLYPIFTYRAALDGQAGEGVAE